MKPRSPGQTATSFSCEETLLRRIDDRARSLNMNRSQYLAALARRDLVEGGPGQQPTECARVTSFNCEPND